MRYAIPKDVAHKVIGNLEGFDVDAGYDDEGLLHILCDFEDESKIMDIVDDMKLPYQNFMWFGSYASDAIIEDLSV